MPEETNTLNMPGGQHSDILLAVGLIGILGALIIPLPTVILDVLLTLNFSYALLVMMVVLGLKSPVDLSTFPSLLLLGTLFRLGLNVASTRLVLLQADAGEVIEAFGGFVVGGELVVGMVIFAILVVIQFVVITKGADRISEVVARFTLDAMPGKQMSIDADLNAGLIDGEEARRRRQNIVREAEFYGSMDGASKYIRGDAIAGLIIIFINLIGGVVIGVSNGMPVTQAISTYSHLTVGDGLVTQIPAVIMSTAAGVLITKSASETGLSSELGFQMFSNPRAIGITAAAVFGFMLVPGLPALPFMVLGVVLSGTAVMVHRQAETEIETTPEAEEETEAPADEEEESVRSLLSPERIALEVGFGLVSLVNPEEGGTLLERIKSLRKKFAREMGVLLPKIRIMDNMGLEGKQYCIKLSGHQVAGGTIYPDRLMAMKSGEKPEDLGGIESIEPSFGLPVVWINPADKEEASLKDYTVVDPESVLITHLSEVLRNHAHEVLSRQDVQELIDNLEQTHPALIQGVIPDKVSVGVLQQVIENLLAEGIPVNDLARIVETCANHIGQVQDVAVLTEHVRKSLRWAICERFSDKEGNLYALTLDPALEDEISNSGGQSGAAPSLSPARLRRIGEVISQNMEQWNGGTAELVLMVSPGLRHQVHELFGPFFPDVPIIAYDELCETVDLHTVDIVSGRSGKQDRDDSDGRQKTSQAESVSADGWSGANNSSVKSETVMSS